MELGSVFDSEAAASQKARDLRWAISVPPSALGHEGGVLVDVPDKLPLHKQPEERACRHIRSDDPPGQILLHLPKGLPAGATLRLRGQGEAVRLAQKAPGDLFLTIRIDPQAKITALALRGPVGMAPVATLAGFAWWWWLVFAIVGGIWFVL